MKTPALLLALAFLPLVAPARSQGTIKATTRMRPDGSTATTIVNPETRTAEETITEAGGKVLSKTIYFLNEQNFAIGATHLDGKGKVRYKESFRFDYAGRIIGIAALQREQPPAGPARFRLRRDQTRRGSRTTTSLETSSPEGKGQARHAAASPRCAGRCRCGDYLSSFVLAR